LLGAPRFYVGRYGTALLMLLTAGFFGLWWLLDFLVLCFGDFRDSDFNPLAGKNKTLCVILFLIFFVPFILAILFILGTFGAIVSGM
jgi:hypothetical protein